MSEMQNENIVLVLGTPASGKSASLRNLPQDKMVYFNCDIKRTPFKNNFIQDLKISNPYDIFEYVAEIEGYADASGGIIDTLTYLMDTVEQKHVLTSSNTQKAWQDYGSFYKRLIHELKAGTKNYAILAHTEAVLNEAKMEYETRVPIKGSVGKKGCEGDFTTIVTAKSMPLTKLVGFENPLLNITEEDLIRRSQASVERDRTWQ